MQELRIRPVLHEKRASASRQCIWCFGTGRVPNDDHQRYDECDVCGGSGLRPTSPAIRVHGRPAIEIVATAA